MLSSAFGQVLNFPLDNAESAHVHLGNFPAKITATKVLQNKQPCVKPK